MEKIGSEWVRGRKCVGCKNFISTRKEHTGYTGKCQKYGIPVKDALCGCRPSEQPGSAVLMNFGETITGGRNTID